MTNDVVSYSVVCDECGRSHDSVGEWLESDPCVTGGPRTCPECGRYDCVFDGIEQAAKTHKRE